MKVSAKIKKEWEDLREHGDTMELARILNLKRTNTSIILNTGEGKTAHIAKIIKFYKARKREQAKLLEQDQD